jgi:hypothetical protein
MDMMSVDFRDQKALHDDDSGRQAFNDIFGLLANTACM